MRAILSLLVMPSLLAAQTAPAPTADGLSTWPGDLSSAARN